MSYDGRLMRQALARFDEDKQRRAENFRARERAVYTKCPRCLLYTSDAADE